MIVDTGNGCLPVRARRWLVAAVLIAACATASVAAPQAELWPRWEAHDAASRLQIDHSQWGRFLAVYLVSGTPDGVSRVRYAAVDDPGRALLAGYIARLETVPISRHNRDEQIAYWANLYNAVTVRLILDNYPLPSIRDIRRPWDAKLVTVEGEPLSLNDIEHRIMRPIWNDPRIHYAVNCASIGCPNLLPEPFTGTEWDAQFDRAARAYVNHPRGVDFSNPGRPALSSIYDWYAVDFGGSIAGVVEHLLAYAEPPLASRLADFAAAGHRTRVRYEYDWALNSP